MVLAGEGDEEGAAIWRQITAAVEELHPPGRSSSSGVRRGADHGRGHPSTMADRGRPKGPSGIGVQLVRPGCVCRTAAKDPSSLGEV